MFKLLKRISSADLPYVLIAVVFLFVQAMTTLLIPNAMADIIDNGMIPGDTEYILSKSTYLVTLAVISALSSICANFIAARVAASFGKKTRYKIFNRVEDFSLNEFDKVGSSSLITRVTNDVTQIQNVINMSFRSIIYSPIMMIGGMFLASKQDLSLLWILLISIAILLISIFVLFYQVTPLFKMMQKKVDRLNLTMRESLIGIRVIRAFNKLKYDEALFKEANDDLSDTAIKANRIMAVMQPIMMLVINLSTVAIVWFGGIRISTGNMEVGDMVAFIQYATTILFSTLMISIVFVIIPRASASAERINEVLDIDSTINDKAKTVTNFNKKGFLEFKNVTFGYSGADSAVIKNVSFKSGPGETTAIIGSTGSGKSSIVNLIPRFYDPTFGDILLDDVNIRDIAQIDLREKIGFVPQGPMLFTGTIKENIQFGKDDATDEEVIRAAEVAQATEFINEIPSKYDSHISQGGTNVSGGQKQRLSIARAVVKEPEVYIFDDSFSALDLKTDRKLRNALNNVTDNATVILVAQKVSTIKNADRIIVLDNGNVVGIGEHKDLMKNCEVYKEIAYSQLSEEELNEQL